MPYKHYCYRAHWLDLSEDARLYMERVFAATRFLENHFVTKYQKVETHRIDPEELKLPALLRTATSLETSDTMAIFQTVELVFVESTLNIIANTWKRVLAGELERPEFRRLTDDQVVWVLDPLAISLYREAFKIPGLPDSHQLNEPKIRLFGEPVCYYLHRDKKGQYYVVFLYERTMAFPFLHQDPSINILGSQIQTLLCPDGKEIDCTSEVLNQVGLLRMRILIKLLATRNNVSVSPSTCVLSAA